MTPEEAWIKTGNDFRDEGRTFTSATDDEMTLRLEHGIVKFHKQSHSENLLNFLCDTIPEIERRPAIRHLLVPLKLQGLI